ncbi:C6 zinc finger domain-containing protein [Plectosphaerella plurivora]|uniref:C6 zinc finger domain-containing protein n=1 Tax=Plectosphaerella plurivora TaxID=936078 RepID=A0A9P8V9B1_9PEZI|nr:C6 zinc finger domain-containing protein [Plectosphaerella plurivora]
MPLRLGYKKSRGGCLRCKKRRVKCDENKPCSACVRHAVPCSLVEEDLEEDSSQHSFTETRPPQRSSSRRTRANRASPSKPQTDPFPYFDRRLLASAPGLGQHAAWIDDLELMHHFTALTCMTLPRSEMLQQVWQVEVPKLGIEYPYVMHQILAVAALHLVSLRPDNNQRHTLDAFRHQTEALAGIRQSIGNINDSNCEALFAASSLLLISAFATFSRSKDWLEEAKTPAIRDIVDVFALVRGMNEILSCSEQFLQRGKFAPIFEIQPESTPSVVLEETRVQLGSLWTHMAAAPNSRLLCRETELLGEWIERCDATTSKPELRYISLILAQDAAALTLLAHYCAVAGTTETSTWYMKCWSSTALRAIDQALDPAWKSYLDWPRTMIADA